MAGYIPRWFNRSHMVTHPSTNRAWRRVTSLIETNALPLSHATNNSIRSLQFTHHRIRLCYSQRYKSHDIYLLVSQVDLTGTTLPDEAKQAENQMFGISTIQYKTAVRLTSLLFLKKADTQIYIRLTQGLVGQFQIYLFCRSCSRDLSLSNYSTILIQTDCCLNCSRHTELSIRTETVVLILKVMADILLALDRWQHRLQK